MAAWNGTDWPFFITASSKTIPSDDSALALVLASASVTWPIKRVPLRRTTWPSCFTSRVVLATTRWPGWHLRASRVVARSAFTVVPLERLADAGPALAEAEADADAETAAAPCAPLWGWVCCGDDACLDCCWPDCVFRVCWSGDWAPATRPSAATARTEIQSLFMSIPPGGDPAHSQPVAEGSAIPLYRRVRG